MSALAHSTILSSVDCVQAAKFKRAAFLVMLGVQALSRTFTLLLDLDLTFVHGLEARHQLAFLLYDCQE
jgi:hypothetical protein